MGHVFCFPSFILFFLVPGHRLKSMIMGQARAKACDHRPGIGPRCVVMGTARAEVGDYVHYEVVKKDCSTTSSP